MLACYHMALNLVKAKVISNVYMYMHAYIGSYIAILHLRHARPAYRLGMIGND